MPVAIVTGASRGIGRAIALRLAEDGMDVAINDLEKQAPLLEKVREEIEQKGVIIFELVVDRWWAPGRKCLCFVTDITNESQVRQMVKETVDSLGPLTTMVANAGIIIPKSMMDTDLDDFSLILNVNVKGTFICYREAARQMIAQGTGGRIIGAASLAAHRPVSKRTTKKCGNSGSRDSVSDVLNRHFQQSHGSTPYAASKWAVRGLTQSMAYDLAEYDINVNGLDSRLVFSAGTFLADVDPKPIMWEQIDEVMGKEQGLAKGEAFARSVEARCALKRPSVPDDIAALVSFLAGPGSRNITGQALIVDGAENKDETERGAKMNTIATVFSLLGAYTEAFDLYLLVYYHFRENDGKPNATYPQVVHSAINCVRLAQTTLQMQISRAMLGDVRGMLLSRYGRQSMAGTTTWKYLERARSQHVCMRGRDQTIEPLESFEEQAYWAVSALVLSRDHLGKECGVAPDYCMNSWKGSIMDHLYETQDQLDRHLPWASKQLSVLQGYRYAEVLACLVLEQCVVNRTNFSIGPDHTESENHQGFPCDLKGLAVAILPFMLWTEIFVEALETMWWPSTPLPSFLFHQAIRLMRQKIEESPAFYKRTIQSVVAHFFPTSDVRQFMPCLIPNNTLKRIGLRVAGLLPLPATVVPETEEPRHPPPQTASAWPEFPRSPGSERFLLNSGSLTLAQSCTSSNSSDYRRFWLTASGPRPKTAASTATQQTAPSDQMSSHSSLRFSRVTGLPSNPSLTTSDDVVSLDVSMGG
ncbi:hypothetical protein AYO21_02479 [Fonsecaea monophora]|uniref:Uncharacterized protein n=1 Tax=Fonsecaea monophora TaxID=254056 RepID=A0A177FFZ8_9EURO|nr:hypothetical protein AYO21_02479 [Fonsecaea monophora]OAG43193.1 hypothetical protein AYO21_02479 [Fonsecaea monophora]